MLVVEGAFECRQLGDGEVQPGIRDDDDGALRAPQPGIDCGSGPEPAVEQHDLRLARGQCRHWPVRHEDSLDGARPIVDNAHPWCVIGDRAQEGEGSPRRLTQDRRNTGAGAVADRLALGDVRWVGRLKSERTARVDHAPAGHLDPRLEAVGLGPIAIGTSGASRLGHPADLDGRLIPGHRRRIAALARAPDGEVRCALDSRAGAARGVADPRMGRPGQRLVTIGGADPAGELAIDDHGAGVADLEDAAHDIRDRRIGQRQHHPAVGNGPQRIDAGRCVEPAQHVVRADLGLDPVRDRHDPERFRTARAGDLDGVDLVSMERVVRNREPVTVDQRLEHHLGEVDRRLGVQHVGEARSRQVELAHDQAVGAEGPELDLHRSPRGVVDLPLMIVPRAARA
ncbi:MAG: hypothetical protein FJ038_09150 [Chloroflexi bacterium]|nr:hypothetical protein [Chloroflexota bacterium]